MAIQHIKITSNLTNKLPPNKNKIKFKIINLLSIHEYIHKQTPYPKMAIQLTIKINAPYCKSLTT